MPVLHKSDTLRPPVRSGQGGSFARLATGPVAPVFAVAFDETGDGVAAREQTGATSYLTLSRPTRLPSVGHDPFAGRRRG